MQPHDMKKTIDKAFEPLVFTKAWQAQVFSALKGEKKVKRKLKLNVVLALALMLVGLTAIAVVSLRDTGKFVATTEQTEGDFAAWQPSKKAQLVTELIAQGYIKETDIFRPAQPSITLFDIRTN